MKRMLLAILVLVCSALSLGCGGSGRADGDTGTEGEDVPHDGDLDTETDEKPDGDVALDGDLSADNDADPPPDCGPCQAFPGRYCFLSGPPVPICDPVPCDDTKQRATEVHVEALDVTACVFRVTYLSVLEDYELNGLVSGCKDQSLELSGPGWPQDDAPLISFSWDHIVGTVRFDVGGGQFSIIWGKQACVSDGDAAVDGDTGGDGETQPDGDIDPDTEDDSQPDGDAGVDLICSGGVCTDTATGFEWQEVPTGGTMAWDNAVLHCQNLNVSGTGWRLPNISELRSLVRGCPASEAGGSCGVTDGCRSWDPCRTRACDGCSRGGGPADGCYWPEQLSGTCTGFWWSSSELAELPDAAWHIDFSLGSVYLDGKRLDGICNVRCVR